MDEFTCPKCKLDVLDEQNSIFCDSCQNWLHLKCSGLKLKRFQELAADSTAQWFCKDCVVESCGALPFNKLKNLPFLKLISLTPVKEIRNNDFQKKCSVCLGFVNLIKNRRYLVLICWKLCTLARYFREHSRTFRTQQEVYQNIQDFSMTLFTYDVRYEWNPSSTFHRNFPERF